MARAEPFKQIDGELHDYALVAGTRLTRVHSSAFGLLQFNPTIAHNKLRGGRFDATDDDPFAFLYAASDDRTALSEALLRDLPPTDRGARVLPQAQIADSRIGWLAATVDLRLVSLRSGLDLAVLGQDTWLTTGPARDYALTRRWAAAIRRWAPWCAGLTWRSRREPDGFAFVLFADRCPPDCLVEVTEDAPLPIDQRRLDQGLGKRYLEQILLGYRVVLR